MTVTDRTAAKVLLGLAVGGTALCVLCIALTWPEITEAMK